MILCDTNILIEFYKNNTAIIQELRQIGIHQLAIRMFEKFWAIRNRYYTSKVHLRGLTQNQGFQPTEVGFVCVAAISNRQGWYEFRLFKQPLKDFRFIQGLNIYNPIHSP
jgi:tRNA(fMet)-specific endonuclease VapC